MRGPSRAHQPYAFVVGVASGTHIEEAKATSYSSDVFAEGNAVVRTNDTTTQNHANTTGYVDFAAPARAGVLRPTPPRASSARNRGGVCLM